jgi:hypothetical protein
MSNVLFEPSNSYLLECHLKPVNFKDPFATLFGEQIELEFIFENHSGIAGDVLSLRIRREDFENFKNVLKKALGE